jgi:hypothetical protein
MSPARNSGLWPGLIADIPAVFRSQVNGPAFSYDGVLDATLCLWRQPDDTAWPAGSIAYPGYGSNRTSPDGPEMLLILCDAGPTSYLALAADYYEIALDSDAAANIWALRPLDPHHTHRAQPGSDDGRRAVGHRRGRLSREAAFVELTRSIV